MPKSQNSAQTTLNYKGKAFDEHSLDLNHISDAIHSMRVLMEKAAAVKNEPAPVSRLRVRDGSVVFDLTCVARAQDGLLAIGDPAALLDLIFKMDDLVGRAGNAPEYILSLFGLALWLDNRKIKSRKDLGGDRFQITASDNATVIVNAKVVKLADDKQVRQAVKGLTAPLAESDAEYLEIGRNGQPNYKITKQDRSRIGIGEPEIEKLSRKERRQLSILHAPLSVEQVRGKKKRKESFHFEDRRLDEKYWAEIKDAAFMSRFRSGEQPLVYGTQMDCDIEEFLENAHDGQPAKVIERIVSKVHGIVQPLEQREWEGLK